VARREVEIRRLTLTTRIDPALAVGPEQFELECPARRERAGGLDGKLIGLAVAAHPAFAFDLHNLPVATHGLEGARKITDDVLAEVGDDERLFTGHEVVVGPGRCRSRTSRCRPRSRLRFRIGGLCGLLGRVLLNRRIRRDGLARLVGPHHGAALVTRLADALRVGHHAFDHVHAAVDGLVDRFVGLAVECVFAALFGALGCTLLESFTETLST
jgi:hypothetical protein